ncbi:glycosyltransferase family 2 protein [Planococcus faecalis]|uniref:Glycosyltransferase 2-like domain-containing protein n=1 Tax=Planococcus faecalis TaxID=1598147 RepID=A0ABM6IV06_9BACL|nr:glycosyltransferase family A protein [Planococcus faecalis]AQU80217.1 hypothetical protein AJGP001_13450 [Planococcus faecalis]OHX51980.1 hypothetical protein BB777_03665 [Planococcus faecalis]
MEITIFTPTYNRAYTLLRLYNSLKAQTNKNFIWLIVDDGSTDNSKELIENWINHKFIEIVYYKQKNQGKSMAHNKGVNLTRTELFTCVDSDDYLEERAVEYILNKWNSQKSSKLTGILAYKGLPENKTLTSMDNVAIKSSTLNLAYSRYGLKGDTMLIFRKDILSKYKFPQFSDEKFVPEAYLYDLVDQEGELLFLREVLYYCEYLEDGYTNNMAKLLADNPKGYLAYIKQRLIFDRTIKSKITNTIRYIGMCICAGEKKYIQNSVYPKITFILMPVGYIFFYKKYKNINT